MDFMDRLILSLLALHSLSWNAIEAEFCFRKIHGPHPTNASIAICRGLMEHKTFSSAKACCAKGGKGFYDQVVEFGSRKKKWKCVLCSGSEPLNTTVMSQALIPDLFVTNGTGWSDWGSWTLCSVSCAAGVTQRQRICLSKDKPCVGVEKEKLPCSLTPYCPVNGMWGPWHQWSECSKPCDGGERRRVRVCNDPPPQYGGKACDGLAAAEEQCNVHVCPQDGGWSEWYSNGVCSTTCGRGVLQRARRCDNPAPINGGKYCEGRENENQSCEQRKCPLDGGWSLWSRWTACDAECGEGKRIRTRGCDAPKPRHGGKDCVGLMDDIQTCFRSQPCPVEGGWSLWGQWGPCFANPCTGERGLQKRSRTCTQPMPQYRGSMCIGNHTDIQECFNNYGCPVNGAWCPWSNFTECRRSDQGPFKMKTRICQCPLPENGGLHCTGDDFLVESCGIEGRDVGSGNFAKRCAFGKESPTVTDDEDC